MSFQISALPHETFAHLFGLPDEALAQNNTLRVTATSHPGYPCRISLVDAAIGETLLLLNHQHQPAKTPYQSNYAIYVRENAIFATPAINEIPEILTNRPLALRAFCATGLLKTATLATAATLPETLAQLFENPDIAYIHIHNAAHGCYAARADRAPDI